MSLQSIYSTARRSLLSSQAGISATGNNIANSETPGYTRRSASSQLVSPTRGGLLIPSERLSVGAGTGPIEFGRVRSDILDTAVRFGQAGSGGAGESSGLLAAVESQIAPDGGDGFLGAIAGFYDAWSDVSVQPADLGARDALLVAADGLSYALRGADARLESLGNSVQSDLQATVGQVNALMSEMADLNVDIRRAGVQGAENLDALDRRDLIMDELSGLAPFSYRAQADGTVTATIDGMIGVQGGEARAYRFAAPPDVSQPSIFPEGASRPLRLEALEGGVLGAQLGVLNDTIPETRGTLDAIAAEIVATVNAVHSTGVDLDGGTGNDFFDPTGLTAATIGRNATLSSRQIAAGAGGTGDGSIAATITDLGDGAYTAAVDVLVDVGLRVNQASAAAEASAAYVDHAMALRDGVSKVSIDEEMANLIRFQQTYAASARVIQTANQMFDTLLAM
ncbi:flagellar hook-associated protein FlgK [Rubrivirga sp.]|uniref:flagellar hook-associated protein FlgK n=1 Tax=Rubrivirga sp. TaxID=1885344 RepID=UPI003C7879D9